MPGTKLSINSSWRSITPSSAYLPARNAFQWIHRAFNLIFRILDSYGIPRNPMPITRCSASAAILLLAFPFVQAILGRRYVDEILAHLGLANLNSFLMPRALTEATFMWLEKAVASWSPISYIWCVGAKNAAERASAYLLLGVDGDLAVALQAATGVVRGTHLGALEVGGNLSTAMDLMSSIWHMSLSTGQVP